MEFKWATNNVIEAQLAHDKLYNCKQLEQVDNF